MSISMFKTPMIRNAWRSVLAKSADSSSSLASITYINSCSGKCSTVHSWSLNAWLICFHPSSGLNFDSSTSSSFSFVWSAEVNSAQSFSFSTGFFAIGAGSHSMSTPTLRKAASNVRKSSSSMSDAGISFSVSSTMVTRFASRCFWRKAASHMPSMELTRTYKLSGRCSRNDRLHLPREDKKYFPYSARDKVARSIV